MYTNLLLFLVAIFLFTIESVPDVPLLGGLQAVAFSIFLLFGFDRLVQAGYKRPAAWRASGYFRTEKFLSISALIFFAILLYTVDPKYYLSKMLGDTLPALVNIGGLLLFVLFLAVMWRGGRRNYQVVFGRRYNSRGFVAANLKANLPIVLPWVVLSLFYDLVALLPFPGVKKLLGSEWGDLYFFGAFLFFVILFFPPMVRRIWGCRRLGEGFLKDHLDTFCAKLGFKADFYLWPLFEGRVLTAGVMGIVPGLRYILITPALIETMSLAELEAIMAHEIGHVKKYHLLLYVFLIAGFSILAGMLAEPLIYLILSMDSVNRFVIEHQISMETVLSAVGSVPLLVFLLIYFRYIFGYFIRNFERQADLYSLQVVGDCRALVSAFEKISAMSGNIREERNWHHFGIGQRIDCLEAAEEKPELINRHNRKVRFSLIGYLLIMIMVAFSVQKIPMERLARNYQENYAETVLLQKVKQEPERAIWMRLIGDLMLNKKMEGRALSAYQKAFSLEPANPEIMNNLAWLLLTAEDLSLRDEQKALTLARAAATLNPKGYVLDTLATAYWANGLPEEAIRTEKEAIAIDVGQLRYYQSRIATFRSQTYEAAVAEAEQQRIEDTGKNLEK